MTTELALLYDKALAAGDDSTLRDVLTSNTWLPGPRMNLGLVAESARVAGKIVTRADAPGDALAEMLDGWAAMSPDVAPGDQPAVILPCAAIASYGTVGAVRPDWWDDELAKIRRAASDSRWRVREMVAVALQPLLGADWDRAIETLRGWASDSDPLVVRAAAAGVAEPPLLSDPTHASDALGIQGIAVESLRHVPAADRRSDPARTLRKALGFTVSVAVAATGDFHLLDSMAASDDPDLHWVARENLKKRRLQLP